MKIPLSVKIRSHAWWYGWWIRYYFRATWRLFWLKRRAKKDIREEEEKWKDN